MPRPQITAAFWFHRFIDFLLKQNSAKKIDLDGANDFANLWLRFKDLLAGAEQAEMQSGLRQPTVKEQNEAWAVVEENPALFGPSATRFKWQVAQKGVDTFALWQTVEPFRSAPNGVCAVAVEAKLLGNVSPGAASRGEVFGLGAITTQSVNGRQRVEWNLELSDSQTPDALKEVPQKVFNWFGLPAALVLLEYTFRGGWCLSAVPRMLQLLLSARSIRRRLASCDVYFVAKLSIATPLQGQSIVAPAFAALALSLMRSSDIPDLWMRAFPHLEGAVFSGHPDKWEEVPIDEVPQKIREISRSDYKPRWAFFAQPTDGGKPEKSAALHVRFCKSSAAMMRQTMERRAGFIVENVFTLAALVVPTIWTVQTFWPAPHIVSFAGVDSSIDLPALLNGTPLRIRSGRPISVRMSSKRASEKSELLVRSARLDKDKKRVNLLRSMHDEAPVSEIRCGFADMIATFLYVSDDEGASSDVLEIGLRYGDSLIAWYPLHLSIVTAGAER